MPLIRTSKQDLLNLFQNLGVKEGDTVMPHPSLFSFGRIEGGLETFDQALREAVGPEGTIVVPTFTYSFRRNQLFDPQNSKTAGEIGAYSEFFRKKEASLRSTCPLFSMAAEGPLAQALMERTSPQCFGAGSVYEKLFAANTLFLGLGITYSTGLSAFMHIEKLSEVPYRLDLPLKGRSVDAQGEEFDDLAIHYARDEEQFPRIVSDREPMGEEMEQKEISRKIKYGYGNHIALRAQPMLQFVQSRLRSEPFCMSKSGTY